MNNEDLEFLKGNLRHYISSGISRTAISGESTYHFGMDLNEIKEVTGRQRIHKSFINECVDFLNKNRVEAEYDEDAAAINVVVDLDRCKLNASQARDLTEAQNYFRAENL